MNIPNLPEVAELSKTVIAQIDISDLIKSGLVLEDYYIVPDSFRYGYMSQGNPFSLHVSRSHGWEGNLEIEFSLFVESSESDSNIHISQEISLFINENRELFFICPLLGERSICSKLYLREDFPLFGSAEALKVDSKLKSELRD